MFEKPGEGPLKPTWDDDSRPKRIAPTPKTSPHDDVPAYVPGGVRLGEWGRYDCLGVARKNFKMIGSQHELPMNAEPSQPTTDEDGKWMYGYCTECNKQTVWRKVR